MYKFWQSSKTREVTNYSSPQIFLSLKELFQKGRKGKPFVVTRIDEITTSTVPNVQPSFVIFQGATLSDIPYLRDPLIWGRVGGDWGGWVSGLPEICLGPSHPSDPITSGRRQDPLRERLSVYPWDKTIGLVTTLPVFILISTTWNAYMSVFVGRKVSRLATPSK